MNIILPCERCPLSPKGNSSQYKKALNTHVLTKIIELKEKNKKKDEIFKLIQD